jgi:hypothetical protein
METAASTATVPAEPKTLLEAIRYYSDLDIATKAFAALRWPRWSGLSLVRVQREFLHSKPPWMEM